MSVKKERGKITRETVPEENSVDQIMEDTISPKSLLWATERTHDAASKQLFKKGTDPESTYDCGQTGLSRAAERGDKDAIDLLLITDKANADTQDTTGWTPLAPSPTLYHLSSTPQPTALALRVIPSRIEVLRPDLAPPCDTSHTLHAES